VLFLRPSGIMSRGMILEKLHMTLATPGWRAAALFVGGVLLPITNITQRQKGALNIPQDENLGGSEAVKGFDGGPTGR